MMIMRTAPRRAIHELCVGQGLVVATRNDQVHRVLKDCSLVKEDRNV